MHARYLFSVNSLSASTSGFAVGVEEAKKIIQAIDSADHMTIVQKEGITLAGEHYMFMRNGLIL